MKVYELEYFNGCGLCTIRIRANDVKAAKRVAKNLTGVLIKNMHFVSVMGCGFKAAND